MTDRGTTGTWLVRSVRGAGIGGWFGAAALAIALAGIGVVLGEVDELLDLAIAGMIVGGLLFGPIVGAAAAAAISGASTTSRIDRAWGMGTFWGGTGALALWGMDRGLSGGETDPLVVAGGGAIVGALLGALCGAIVALHLRRRQPGN